MATALATDPRTLHDLRALIAALRAARWRHRLTWTASERDEDGAPWHNGYHVHTWSRGDQEICYWAYADDGRPLGSIRFRPDGDEGEEVVAVGVDWVATHGVAALHRIAEIVGVFEPVASNDPWEVTA